MIRLDADATVSCSLNDADFHKRRAHARQRLIPKVMGLEHIENGLIFRFDAEAKLEADVRKFVDLERQCCGFLTFTLISATSDPLVVTGLKIEGPPEAAPTLEIFAQAVEPVTSNQETTKSCGAAETGYKCRGTGGILPSDNLDTKSWLRRIRRTGWSGLIVGGLAVLACELPLFLAALGLGGLSAGAIALRPPQFVVAIAIIAALLGAFSLIGIFVVRKIQQLRNTA